MERLLRYVWKYKLYVSTSLTTTDGLPVAVIDPGIQNTGAGPDFINAKLKIGGTVWAGSVEIHEKSSDGLHHHRDSDKAYDSVILHVTGENDASICRMNGEPMPQLLLSIPEPVRKNIDWLLAREGVVPCLERIQEVDSVHLASWMDTLLGERLERKTADIYRLLDQYQEDWNEVFYIRLTRSFGFGAHSDAFEKLAQSLPLRYIQKQRASESQVEAMLFGQAGMLSEEGSCHYYRLLRREYAFLRHKFDLKPLDEPLFKSPRVRPTNSTHVKLAQLAAIWHRYDTLFSRILSASSPKEIKDYFRIRPSDYWKNHNHFRYASPEKEKTIGENTLDLLLINAVVPLFFAYGRRNHLPEYCARATRLLERIPPERNHIVTAFTRFGICVRNAGDTQSLIQLKREYCEKRRCLYCRIGFRLLKQGANPPL
ncbi:DUF2851 family protein [Parabacteroides sp. ZJ-118]|uniref:DUF2851 family protein n=1 Tax=Parabacteroides sp. ZJ-118 TaxID=2709398 RepID=UPI0013ED6887|nr:DUF2851 family protein [Parabacteroides sp. ZJ-118]